MTNQTNTAISPFSDMRDDMSVQPIDLRRCRRIGETIIQVFLFVCGPLSIFTTIGIVYGLAKESIDFFTHQLWEESNKSLVTTIDESIDTFELSSGGSSLDLDDVTRINDEIMIIIGIGCNKVTIIRGEKKLKPFLIPLELICFKA